MLHKSGHPEESDLDSISIPTELCSIKHDYRTGVDDLAEDFWRPCLNNCDTYSRAVGYFSSSSLVVWSEILPSLVSGERDIKFRLLISPNLSQADIDTIKQVTDDVKRQKLLQDSADKIVSDALSFNETNSKKHLQLRMMAWLIAKGHIELRFAFPKHIGTSGLFHEKIGFFTFGKGCRIAFTGSANETFSGHTSNYESIDVFCEWNKYDRTRVERKVLQFNEAWEGLAHGLQVRELSSEVMELVKKIGSEYGGPLAGSAHDANEDKKKWQHQDEAIKKFMQVEKGVLEMATGTGKTWTALRICNDLLESKQINSIIISADGTDLLNQWHKQLLKMATDRDISLTVLRHYERHQDSIYYTMNQCDSILLISRLALPEVLKEVSSNQAKQTLLIHDEVHKLGSPGNCKKMAGLSDDFRFRLGLSATPDREYDDEGTAFINAHIGPVCYKFNLADAISKNILSPFNYYPLEYEQDDNDSRRLQDVFKQEAARASSGNPMSKEERWMQISRVHKTSLAKLPIFDEFIRENRHLLNRCIIFVEETEYGKAVLRIVHKYKNNFHEYYGGEDSAVLERFARGDLECLITCNRLSEGIDIRSISNVILFASPRSKLVTIQRVGRCLRVDPENELKTANVIDFIRSSPTSSEDNADSYRRDWLSDIAKKTLGGTNR